MSNCAARVIKLSKYWTRIAVSLQVCLKPALLDVLHNKDNDSTYVGLPDDEKQLYQILLKFKTTHKKKLKVLKPFQWDILCPPCCQTNSNDLDITTIIILIINLTTLKCPSGGWKQTLPVQGDTSRAAYCLLARQIRNDVNHCSVTHVINEDDFNDYWKIIRNIIVGLDYKDIAMFDNLKTESLDPYMQQKINAMSDKLADMDNIQVKIDEDHTMKNEEIKMLKQAVEDLETRLSEMKTNRFSLQHSVNVVTVNQVVYSFEENNYSFEENLITEEENNRSLEEASIRLKARMCKRYSHMSSDSTFTKSSNNDIPQTTCRDDTVVNLSLLKGANTTLAVENCERLESFRLQEKLSSLESEYDEIVSTNKNSVIISGVPGIGKTTLTETMLHLWSQNKLWYGIKKKLHFKFVFILYFRDFTRYLKNPEITAKNILKFQNDETFDHINFKDLRRIKDQVLLILEGFDEFSYVEQLKNIHNDEVSACTQAVYDLINPDNSTLPFMRIITSRPCSCSILLDIFQPYHFKVYEITGFSDQNISRYISRHFHKEQDKISIHNKINDSIVLKAMMHIPFFCWGICCLLQDNMNYNVPETYTSLYSNLLLVFLRNHGQRKSKSKKLKDVLGDLKNQEIILSLAKLAYVSLTERKVTFTEEDFKGENINFSLLVQRSGLLIKVDHDRDYGTSPTYQFLFYTFHEFLSALHIFHKGLNHTMFTNKQLLSVSDSTVLPIVTGLLGGLVQNSNSDNIVKHYARLFHSNEFKQSNFNKVLQTFLGDLNIDRTSLFLASIFEYQNKVILHEELCLFGNTNTTSYKQLCLSYLNEQVVNKNIILKNIELFYDSREWAAIIPYVKHVKIHLISCAEYLMETIPIEMLAAVQNSSLVLKDFCILQNVSLGFVYECLPYIENIEIIGYSDDLKVLEFILSEIEPEKRRLLNLKFHLVNTCSFDDLLRAISLIEHVTIIYKANSTTGVHVCTRDCIQPMTWNYTREIYDEVNKRLLRKDIQLGVLKTFHTRVSCWFESENLDYIYKITTY